MAWHSIWLKQNVYRASFLLNSHLENQLMGNRSMEELSLECFVTKPCSKAVSQCLLFFFLQSVTMRQNTTK